MDLIIVESPTKCKTISKFLGPKYKVLSSYGHIRDLPKSKLGIDVENNFEPQYVIPTKARKRVKELKDFLPKAEKVILGSDEDREGESIAWHLVSALKLEGKKDYKRIVFHEITKSAIEKALKNPRDIDINLVNAQQARRILDRLVGYKLSPLLWKKIMRGLSAGRVQSVVLKLIVEKEKEIKDFIPQEYWTIVVDLEKEEKNSLLFEASLIKKDDKVISKLDINNKKGAEEIIKNLENAEYKIINIIKKEIKKNPFPPFQTSTLQQQAWTKFHFSAKKTMFLAQNLYEKGSISYHRTDSLNLSEESLIKAQEFITKNYGANYWAGSFRRFKTRSKTSQEAHEAIRPTNPEETPDNVKSRLKLEKQQYQLYSLIWQRFIASQMKQACFDSTQIDISAKNYIFRSNGQTLKFDGFLKVYQMKTEENELPSLEENEVLRFKKLNHSQHFTQPPSRYNEASIIKVLEKEGIGRPSTYAPTLDVIQRRNYVNKDEKKRFQPTEIGVSVSNLLSEHFPKIVDIKFTSQMEENLDKIAKGEENWVKVLDDFYRPFEKNLKEKEEKIIKKHITEETDEICPECGNPLLIRWSRYGKFYGCSNFPKCKYKKSLARPSLGIKCPKCEQGEIVEKRTKRGKTFYACNKWPECDFALWDKPNGEICPKCNSLMVVDKKEQTKCSNKECK